MKVKIKFSLETSESEADERYLFVLNPSYMTTLLIWPISSGTTGVHNTGLLIYIHE